MREIAKMSTTNAASPSSAGTLSPSASNANTTTIASATTTATSVAPSSSTIPTVALLFQLNNLYRKKPQLNEHNEPRSKKKNDEQK